MENCDCSKAKGKHVTDKQNTTGTLETNRGLKGHLRWPWIAAFCLMVCFIWGNSLEPASTSGALSGGVLEFLQGCLAGVGLPYEWLTDHIVRKMAHFCEYMLEGFLLTLCLRVYTRRFVRHISWPILGGLLTALTDETIQMFSDGRSSQITDVWLDFSGVLTGILVGMFCLALCRMCWLLYKHRNED